MSSLRAAFLRDIIEHLGDDVPRLIFADWLEEQGEGEGERAEFIRVQCELAKTFRPLVPTISYHDGEGVCVRCSEDAECRYHALRRRERELLREDGPMASSEFFDRYFSTPEGQGFWLGDACFYATLRRGLVAEVSSTCAAWLTHGTRLLKASPLERLTLTHAHDQMVFCPEANQLVSYVYPASSRAPMEAFTLEVEDGRLWRKETVEKCRSRIGLRIVARVEVRVETRPLSMRREGRPDFST